MAVVDSVCFMLCCVSSGSNGFCMFHVMFIYNGGSGLYMYVSCCVVFPVTVVDYVCFMPCCIYSGGSGLCMFHAVLFFQ